MFSVNLGFMKAVSLFFLCCVCLIMTVSCRRHDYRTVNIYVPAMTNEATAQVVGTALSKVEGVNGQGMQLDIPKMTVTLTYDSLVTALKNIEFAVAEAGYDAFTLDKNGRPTRGVPASALRKIE